MSLRIVLASILMLMCPGICLTNSIAQDQPDSQQETDRRFRRGGGERGQRGGEGRRRGRFSGPGAQQGPGGGRGFGGGSLLQNSLVREELGVDDAQFEKLREAGEEMRGKMGEMFQEMMAAREEGGDMGEMRDKMRGMQDKLQEKVKTILSEAQYRRLKQAEMQQRLRTIGIGALATRETSSSLDLTDEQQQTIREQMRTRFGGARMGERANRGERQPDEERPERRRRPENTALSFDAAREQAAEVLDEDQMKQLDEMLGREFELPEEALTMRGFGGRGGRGRPVGPEGPRGGRRERPEPPRSESESQQ